MTNVFFFSYLRQRINDHGNYKANTSLGNYWC